MTVGHDPARVKACCANAYSSDIVGLLLGDSYHPGGLTLTRHLATLLGLQPGQRVLDLAAGRGTTALLLAHEHRVHVNGLDLSAANIALARGVADDAGLADQVTFTVGDAEHLPYPDAAFDAVICECALCTFPDKPQAVSEIARVLKPGGRLGLTDVTADPTRLPAELQTLAAWAACVADARPLAEYTTLLAQAGLTVTTTEHHSHALTRMIDQIEARLQLVRMTARQRAETLGIDFTRAGPILAAARAAVANGELGYGLVIARREGAPSESGRTRHGLPGGGDIGLNTYY